MGSHGYGGWHVGICSVGWQAGDAGDARAGADEVQRQSAQEVPLEQEGQSFHSIQIFNDQMRCTHIVEGKMFYSQLTD